MLKFYGIFVISILTNVIISQNCPSGDYFIMSQNQIDSFAILYPECTIIHGNLTISDNQIDPITNLSGLQRIENIKGLLKIKTLKLEDLRGLNMLSSIGNGLILEENKLLSSDSGLENAYIENGQLTLKNNAQLTELTAVKLPDTFKGRVQLTNNPNLVDISAFQTLDTISLLIIGGRHGLLDMSGFDNLKYVGGQISIFTTNIKSLNGLERLSNFGDTFLLWHNDSLRNVKGLEGLENIDATLRIFENDGLLDLKGLDQLSIAGEDLIIENNASLNSLSGLENLDIIENNLIITDNQNLTSINGLLNLTFIKNDLAIINNSALSNIEGLENMAEIGASINIENNKVLSSLAGLDALSIDKTGHISITNNPNLEFCSLTNICNDIDNKTKYTIENNKEGCSSVDEVITACELITTPTIQEQVEQFSIYPNPTSGIIRISGAEKGKYQIVNSSGLILKSGDLIPAQQIDLHPIEDGLYFFHFISMNQQTIEALIVLR